MWEGQPGGIWDAAQGSSDDARDNSRWVPSALREKGPSTTRGLRPRALQEKPQAGGERDGATWGLPAFAARFSEGSCIRIDLLKVGTMSFPLSEPRVSIAPDLGLE